MNAISLLACPSTQNATLKRSLPKFGATVAPQDMEYLWDLRSCLNQVAENKGVQGSYIYLERVQDVQQEALSLLRQTLKSEVLAEIPQDQFDADLVHLNQRTNTLFQKLQKFIPDLEWPQRPMVGQNPENN